MKTTPSASSLMSRENLYFLVLAALLLLVFPVLLDAFRLNLVGKYLTYAFVAVGLVLCWGKGAFSVSGRASFSDLAAIAWPCS